MIPQELKQLIEKYCMGMKPTDAQTDEIFDKVFALGADTVEAANMMEKLQNGPTREQMEAQRRAEEQRAREEAERKAKEEAERKEAERKRQEAEEARRKVEAKFVKSAFMDIKKMEFANYGGENFISGYGEELIDDDMRYLKARIIYDGLLDWDKEITVFIKIIKPDGSVKNSSADGFTFSDSIKVKAGKNNQLDFSGWGRKNESSYEAGTYRYELWYEGHPIYKASFEVKSLMPSITVNKIDFKNIDNRNAAVICEGVAKHIEKAKEPIMLQLYIDGIHFGGVPSDSFFINTQDVEIKSSGNFKVDFKINEDSFWTYKLKRKNGHNEYLSWIRWGEDVMTERKVFSLYVEYAKHLWKDEMKITNLEMINS